MKKLNVIFDVASNFNYKFSHPIKGDFIYAGSLAFGNPRFVPSRIKSNDEEE